jgi:hypothetical protein
MKIRPYHTWGFLAALLLASAWRTFEWSRIDLAVPVEKLARWPLLARLTTEELDNGVAHRYVELARDLGGERDVGYFSERDRTTLWSDSSPDGKARIFRYYMAQSILAPCLLRLDEPWPLVVVDCRTPEQAKAVEERMRLSVVHDYGQGLILARPGKQGG